MNEFKWKDSEKKIANRVYEKARLNELDELVASFKAQAAKVYDTDQLWSLMDQMKERRYQFEQKYDYHYSVLISVLARLVGEDRFAIADLAGFDEKKLATITVKSEFFRR
jgi:hypothetical protein